MKQTTYSNPPTLPQTRVDSEHTLKYNPLARALTGSAAMNKLMATLFFLGAIGSFSLSQRNSYQVQDQTRTGKTIGKVRTVSVTYGDKYCFVALGLGCMVASFCFLAKTRGNGLR